MVSFEAIIIPLSTALGLSLVVERAIEFLNNVFGYLQFGEKLHAQPDLAALEKRIAELDNEAQDAKISAEKEDAASNILALLDKNNSNYDETKVDDLKKRLADYQRELELDETVPANVLTWQAATAPSGERIYREIIVLAVGFALGIFLATISDLKLFNVFFEAAETPRVPIWLDYVFTGLLISAGSGPIHVLIRFVSERKVMATAEQIKTGEQEKQKKLVGASFTPGADSPALDSAFQEADWIPIAYEGGVDREKLENRN